MRTFDKLLNYAKLVWKDPVWSKVIATLLIGSFASMAYFLDDSFRITLPLWLVITVPLLLCFSTFIFLFLWLAEKSKGYYRIPHSMTDTEDEQIVWAKGRKNREESGRIGSRREESGQACDSRDSFSAPYIPKYRRESWN